MDRGGQRTRYAVSGLHVFSLHPQVHLGLYHGGVKWGHAKYFTAKNIYRHEFLFSQDIGCIFESFM